MPELPEVETIRAGLAAEITSQVIGDVQILNVKTFLESRALVGQVVAGQKITHIKRRAKLLIWNLANGYNLVFHLKMTGQMVLVKAKGGRFAGGHPTASMAADLPDASTRVIFRLLSGDVVFFNDQRKFGWVKLLKAADMAEDSLMRRLGPEPLTDEFTVGVLSTSLQRHARASIKSVVLDQSSVAGLGNIYADESLHLARIHPQRLAGSLSAVEVARLHSAIKEILALAINYGGTSFTSYLNAFGQQGDYLQHARVFRRTGQPCPVCATIVRKIRVAGRGTHICPKCQSPD